VDAELQRGVRLPPRDDASSTPEVLTFAPLGQDAHVEMVALKVPCVKERRALV
jgi:hypothetical protein